MDLANKQLLWHVIDTTVNLISLFNPNSQKTKLLITLLAQEYGFKSRNISFFPPRKCLRYTYIHIYMYINTIVQGEIVFIKGSCCKKTQVVRLPALDTPHVSEQT